MDTKNKLQKISFIKNQIMNEGPENIKDVEPTINQVLKDIFGIGNEFVKKADKIMGGFIVPSSASLIYGKTTKEQFNIEKFEMYMKLIAQAEAYISIDNTSSPYIDNYIHISDRGQSAKVFLSYCWNDTKIANEIDEYLQVKGIDVIRDIRNVDNWQSLRDFMQTIRDNDYAVLLISDAYLKSTNCMYEVIEIMKEQKYVARIFPAVIENRIYSTEQQINYVKYWEDSAGTLKNNLSSLQYTNGLALGQELKKVEDISRSIAEFLHTVSDMKNPGMNDVKEAIYERIKVK